MATVGGQHMSEQLTAPAHTLSRALAKNMVEGDTAFLHYSKRIDGMEPPTLPVRTAPTRAAAQDVAVPEELRHELEAAASLAERLKSNSIPLHSHLAKE
eukprot:6882714-Heterocapsa_arctica.AAC.1